MSLFADYTRRNESRHPLDSLIVRHAVQDDLDALVAIVAEREEEAPEIWRPRMEKALERSLEGEEILLVAVVGERVVGYGKGAILHPAPNLPHGWYLTGVVVVPDYRRRGIGEALTAERIAWIARRSTTIYYFASIVNRPTIDLHALFGFVEIMRDIRIPGVGFTGGVGALYRLDGV